MAKLRKSTPERKTVASSSERIARDKSIAQLTAAGPVREPCLRAGRSTRTRVRKPNESRSGPPDRPFRELIAALRAERERQGLSLADLAKRTGMDRAAIHKLEIGPELKSDLCHVDTVCSGLGRSVEWKLKTVRRKPIGA